MHAVHLVTMPDGRVRPAVLLTRASVAPRMSAVTFAPITSTIRGLSVEVLVGPENGIDHESVINCDNLMTVRAEFVGSQVGYLTVKQEAKLTQAIHSAFDLL